MAVSMGSTSLGCCREHVKWSMSKHQQSRAKPMPVVFPAVPISLQEVTFTRACWQRGTFASRSFAHKTFRVVLSKCLFLSEVLINFRIAENQVEHSERLLGR